MNTRLEKILNKLEKMMFGAEVYNDDFNGTYIGNLLCLGDVRAVLEDYINDGWIPVGMAAGCGRTVQCGRKDQMQ